MLIFSFKKWNLQDLIIVKPYRCSQSVVICVHGASCREQWNILHLQHRRNFRVFCLNIAVLKPTFYCVWKKARYFAEPIWKKSLECPFSAENAILETQNSLENLISWQKTYSNSFESSNWAWIFNAIVTTLHVTMWQLNSHYSEERKPRCTRVWNENAQL